ncbi:hypothetical protein BKA69DRAFT_1035226 [Paraphysoderma sedebokerense]|nr:hypothetical protein BKA69DRAFT_1035226 [Paraphysoderma sedebokerense]
MDIAFFIICIQLAFASVTSGAFTRSTSNLKLGPGISQFPGGQWCGSRISLSEYTIPDREIFRSKLQCAVVSSFISDKEDAVYMGIADGQIGDQKPLDLTLFARGLMRSCENAISERPMSPKELLVEGLRSFENSREVDYGGAAAMALKFDKATGILESLNVGLNGYIVIRDGKATVIRSTGLAPPQFEVSYAVGFYDPSMDLDDEEEVRQSLVRPELGALNNFQLQDRDVLIIGTEGLFHALSTRVIEVYVRNQLLELVDNSVEARQIRQYQPAMLQHLDILAETLGRAAMDNREQSIDEGK